MGPSEIQHGQVQSVVLGSVQLQICAQTEKNSLREELTESSFAEKNLRVLVVEKLSVNQKCALAGLKAHCMLGCIKRGAASRA